jgi:hypothetical protein
MFTFGQIKSYQSDVKVDPALSDDKRALSLNFTGFEIRATDDNPLARRMFDIVLPVEGKGKEVEIEFSMNGFAITMDGSTAALIVSVNGETIAAGMSGENDGGLLKSMTFKAKSASECRLSVVLLAGCDAANDNAEAFAGCNSIEAEFLPRPPQPKG